MKTRSMSGLVLTSLLVAGSFVAQPAFAETGGGERAEAEQPSAVEDAFADIELLAEGLGISEELAQEWFDGESEFVTAVDYAVEVAGDQYFSSAWTPDEQGSTGFKAWVSFKGEAPVAVVEKFEALEFPVELRFDAEHSEIELEEIRAELMSELYESAELDGLTGDFTDDGGIEIEYELAESEAAPEEFEALLAEVVEEAPVKVEVDEASESVPVEEVLRGGTRINSCTLGFTVTKGSTRGALTAGHCPNSAGKPTGSSVALKFVRQHIGSYGDIQFHSTTDTLRNEVRISSGGSVRKITSRSAGTKGSTVCNYGRTRSSASCTTIRNTNHAFYNSNGVYVKRMVQTNGKFTNGGDSGGPWYFGQRARGIHFGKSGGYSTYTRIGAAEAQFGVRVKIS